MILLSSSSKINNFFTVSAFTNIPAYFFAPIAIISPVTSVVDPKLFFSDPDPTLTVISDPDSNPDPDPACL
jgi:hypothetical protein